MSRVYDRLKEAEKIGRNTAKAKLAHQPITEILEGLTKEQRQRMEKRLLGELLARRSPIRVEVTCPRCKRSISLRFRLRLKSKERNAK